MFGMFEKDEKEEARREQEERILREAWHDTLATESGYRVFSWLLTQLGAGRMTNSEEGQTMKNVAEQLLDIMADAHPTAYLRFCGEMRRVNINSRGDDDE